VILSHPFAFWEFCLSKVPSQLLQRGAAHFRKFVLNDECLILHKAPTSLELEAILSWLPWASKIIVTIKFSTRLETSVLKRMNAQALEFAHLPLFLMLLDDAIILVISW
jgi:hypothetical protein